jgi:hypothetical protein
MYISPALHECDKVPLMDAVFAGSFAQHANAGACLNGNHAEPEALILQFCHAPSTELWAEGQRVSTVRYCILG